MTPNTWIMLCKGVGLIDGENTMYFADNTARYNYMFDKAITVNPSGGDALSQKRLSAQMYKRVSDKTVRVSVDMWTLIGCDYMVMRNYTQNAEQVFYYCFVDDVRYVSEGVSEIDFHEDVYQTWIDSCTFKKTFMKRMTTSTDTLFSSLNDVPDFFNGGGYHTVHKTDVSSVQGTHAVYIVMATTELLYVQGGSLHEVTYNYGSYNGNKPENFFYYVAKFVTGTNSITELFSLAKFILSDATHKGAYLGIYMCPEICLPDSVVTYADAGTPVVMIPAGGTVPTVGDWTVYQGFLQTYKADNWFTPTFGVLKTYLFEGYVPKNYKMYNAPYWKIRIKNNAGQFMDLLPQYCMNKDEAVPQTENNMVFGGKICGVFGMFPFVCLFPDYDGQARNTSYKITLATPPQIPYTNDAFMAWYSQMKLTLPFDLMKGGLNVLSAAASGSGMGVASAIGGITSELFGAAKGAYVASETAPTVSGSSSADFSTLAMSDDKFTIEILSISEGDAQEIDNQLTKYGYAMERIMAFPNDTPNSLNGRPAFAYYQTEGCVPLGNIPGYARTALAEKFDKGMRIWAPANYMNYNVLNTP